jgi:hypothetical protein
MTIFGMVKILTNRLKIHFFFVISFRNSFLFFKYSKLINEQEYDAFNNIKCSFKELDIFAQKMNILDKNII